MVKYLVEKIKDALNGLMLFLLGIIALIILAFILPEDFWETTKNKHGGY